MGIFIKDVPLLSGFFRIDEEYMRSPFSRKIALRQFLIHCVLFDWWSQKRCCAASVSATEDSEVWLQVIVTERAIYAKLPCDLNSVWPIPFKKKKKKKVGVAFAGEKSNQDDPFLLV